ncbi:hypothetical protein D3C87_1742180 [compost metagenome]
MEILPPARGTKPMMALKMVDLPAPLTPTRAVIEPRGAVKLACLRAVVPLR